MVRTVWLLSRIPELDLVPVARSVSGAPGDGAPPEAGEPATATKGAASAPIAAPVATAAASERALIRARS